MGGNGDDKGEGIHLGPIASSSFRLRYVFVRGVVREYDFVGGGGILCRSDSIDI